MHRYRKEALEWTAEKVQEWLERNETDEEEDGSDGDGVQGQEQGRAMEVDG
jgi:hypothetical protein